MVSGGDNCKKPLKKTVINVHMYTHAYTQKHTPAGHTHTHIEIKFLLFLSAWFKYLCNYFSCHRWETDAWCRTGAFLWVFSLLLFHNWPKLQCNPCRKSMEGLLTWLWVTFLQHTKAVELVAWSICNLSGDVTWAKQRWHIWRHFVQIPSSDKSQHRRSFCIFRKRFRKWSV